MSLNVARKFTRWQLQTMSLWSQKDEVKAATRAFGRQFIDFV
jgi:hypothetical protein